MQLNAGGGDRTHGERADRRRSAPEAHGRFSFESRRAYLAARQHAGEECCPEPPVARTTEAPPVTRVDVHGVAVSQWRSRPCKHSLAGAAYAMKARDIAA